MATSGSYLTSKVVNSMTGDGCPDRANISWSASWNPATLQWTVAWSANGAGYYNNNYVTIFSGTVTIKDQNGNVIQTKSMAGQIAQARKDVQLIADSFTLGVDTYGNQSLQFSAVFRIGYNSATGESTGSQTFALDQVPLASYFTYAPSGVTVGSSGGVSTVNITRYNSSYTHDVTWTFGSYSHTETGVGTSVSWTIPATWLNAIPSSVTGTCTVTLVTKSGSTQVGQAATAQFTITANVVPSYTSIVYSYLGTAYSAGITNALIAGYSQMRVAVSGAAGAYGSSVARMEFIKGTSTMATVNTSAASYTYDTPLLTVAETTTFTVRITDTRGKYVQQTSQSFTIKAYAMPSFTAASVYRSNSSGSPAEDGTYIKITATAAATPAENSITSLQYATKETTSSYWSADANIPSGAVSGYSNTTSYDVRLTATDKLGNKAYKYYTIPTQAFTMDFKVGGKGVAFGKVAETDNLVDSAWGIRGTIAPNVSLSISSSADLDNALLSAFQTIPNNQIGYLVVTFSAVVAPFGGGVTFFTIKRTDAQWGTIEGVSYNSGNGAKVYARSMANGALTGWNNPRYISSSITAAANVTIDTGVSNVMRDGKVVSGTVRLTTSAQLTYYAYLFTGLPTAGAEVMCNMTDIYGNPIANSAYINTGATGVRMSLPLNAGQYQVGFTYITIDD